MRQVLPEGFIRQVGSSTSDATVATFKSAQGTIVSIQVLTHSVVRVCHQIGGGSNAAATTENSSPNCTIVGPLGRTCTLKRDIPSLFPCPIVQVTTTPQEDGKGGSSTTTRIETDRLVVEARLHGGSGDLVLCWFIKPSAATLSSASISSSSASSPSSLSPSLVQVAEDLPFRAYAFDRKCSGVYHYMKKPAPNAQANVSKVEHYYGGERASPLDLSGRRFRMDAVDALGYDPELSDPLYKVTPFHLTVVQDPIQSTVSSYGIYYDHLSSGVMDFGCEIDAFYGPYKYFYASETNMLDYYFIAGDTAILNTATPVDATTTPTTTPDHQSLLGSVLQGYMDIIGRPALPPKYAFGYLASAMGYAESENAQAILETFPDMCNKNDIPCDLIHLSSGYTVDPVTGARNVFLWNNTRFPDPRRLFSILSKAGIRVSANIKPWLLCGHKHYNQVDGKGGFVLKQEDTKSFSSSKGRLWSAGEGETGVGSYFDFSSVAGYEYWVNGVKDLLDTGIESIWNDNNEYALPDDSDYYAQTQPFFKTGKGDQPKVVNPFSVGELGRPYQTLLMANASYQAMVERFPRRRPFLITRSSCPGVQRYASQTWSGDNLTAWRTLKHNIPMGIGAGLALFPMGYGHDVGGFVGERPSPELFVRWVQNGVFMARFCIHSWKKEGVTEPWMYPEVLPIIRSAIKFRYQLIPYLYSLAHECHELGHPIVRPTFFHFTSNNSDDLYNTSFEFMLGPHLLVASVLDPHATERSLILPYNGGGGSSGTWWCDIWTGKWYFATNENNNNKITVPVPLEQCGAVFACQGALIPMSVHGIRCNAEEWQKDERMVWAFPPPPFSSTSSSAHRYEYTLMEDDGESMHSKTTRLRLWMQVGAKEEVEQEGGMGVILVGVEVEQHDFPLPYSAITFVMPVGETRRVKVVKNPKLDLLIK